MAWQKVAGGALAAGLSAFSQSKADRENRKFFQQAANEYTKQRVENKQLHRMQENVLRKQRGIVEQGFGKARANLSRFGEGAKRTAMDTASARAAGAEQGLTARGLTGTTVFQNALRGIDYDLVRSMADIDMQIQEAMSGLDLGEMQATLGTQGDLASFFGAKAGFNSSFTESYANLLASRATVGSDFSGLGTLFSDLFGFAGQIPGLFSPNAPEDPRSIQQITGNG